MFDPSVVFQRTHTGRTEIYEKKCGLTQSERLVLIMIDGVASFSGVRAKLPALTDERFARAVRTLQQKELIVEVFMPVADQAPEEVEPHVIDRFLHQDPLDPVTIIKFDEDDLFDLSLAPQAARPVAPAASVPTPVPAPASAPPQPAPVTAGAEHLSIATATMESPASVAPPTRQPVSALDENDVRQAEEIGEQARARQLERPAPEPLRMKTAPELQPPAVQDRTPAGEGVPWVYWAMAVAGAFILGYAFARATI